LLLRAKIKNVTEWKAVLNAIGDLVEDAMFICNSDGITFRGMDPSHVALLDVTFPTSSFEELQSETSFFGLRVEDFKKVMNAATNGDVVELQVVDSSTMKVSIDGTLKMEYNIRLIEKSEVNTPIPKVDYKSKVSLEPNTLSRILSNLQQISEYVTINCHPDKVQFLGKSEMGDAKIDLEKGNTELGLLETSEDTHAVYSLEYMAQIIRSIGRTSSKVSMECASRNPIHMMFEMPSMVRVEYYLAPRVEN